MVMASWISRRFEDLQIPHSLNSCLYQVKAWIIPPDYDHSEAEAKHLVFEADIDHDNLLTKDEILEKYDIFVGSQVRTCSSGNLYIYLLLKATDFGEALTRHDEF